MSDSKVDNGAGTVVIGGASGLGAHLAARFVKAGEPVTVFGRRVGRDVRVPDGVACREIDLAQDSADSLLGDALLEAQPRAIICTAVDYGPGQAATLGDGERMFRVNALVPYLAIRKFVEANASPCSVVLINSDSIYHANEHSGMYAASKAALRVLASALASASRSRPTSVSTLLLGPLADETKRAQLEALAAQSGVTFEEMEQRFLRRSNPSIVIEHLIDLDHCYESLRYMIDLGPTANGMLCKLDGGSSGSLV